VKRPLGRPRHRWEDNIKTDLREIGIDGANWILLAQDRVQWWTTGEHDRIVCAFLSLCIRILG
jgi:hypothetical protein